MEKLVTGPEVVERYKITPQTVISWVADKELGFPKPIKIRGRNFWRFEDLLAFEDRQRAEVS